MRILIIFLNFWQIAGGGPKKKFWSFQIDTQLFFDKMAAGGHFERDDNVNYRTRPRYLDE